MSSQRKIARNKCWKCGGRHEAATGHWCRKPKIIPSVVTPVKKGGQPTKKHAAKEKPTRVGDLPAGDPGKDPRVQDKGGSGAIASTSGNTAGKRGQDGSTPDKVTVTGTKPTPSSTYRRDGRKANP